MELERVKQKYTYRNRKRATPESIKLSLKKASAKYIANLSEEKKEAIKRKKREGYYARRTYYLEQQRKWREENRERRLIYSRSQYALKKEIRNKQTVRLRAIRIASDPFFRKQETIRKKIRGYFKYKGFVKDKTTQDIIGAPFETVKTYLEQRFKPGMTWENHGVKNTDWQIDHIMPLSSAQTEEELIVLFHYTNLQPLWGYENRAKSNKIQPLKLKRA